MRAITVTYFGSTNHRGSRWKAESLDCKAIWLSYDYGAADGGARKAAETLCEAEGWEIAELLDGTLPDKRRVFLVRMALQSQ
jgi:hypothetical protein